MIVKVHYNSGNVACIIFSMPIHLLKAVSNVIFSYSCATADKISTDIARRATDIVRRAVPL